jgi:hypothetical protein
MNALLTELESRWQKLFSALAAGSDVAPSLRLRTEGLMEAAILSRVASAEQLSAQMAASYEDAFGRSLAQDFGSDWQDFFPFPQIPAMAKRAPVYRSTKD